MSTIGPIFNPTVVEKWILAHVEKWQKEYVSELERQEGRDPHFYQLLQNFGVKADYDQWAEGAALPGVLCVSTGIGDDPITHSDSVHGTWVYGLLIVGGANTPENTNNFVKAHAAWIRTLFIQLPDIGHPETIVDTTWVGERYNQVRIRDPRTQQAAALLLEVEVKDVADPFGSPPETPRDDPYGDGAVNPITIQDYDVDITKKEI